MSSIRFKSNKRYHSYNRDGTLNVDNLNGKDRKKYIDSHTKELKRMEEESRPPKVRRKVNGEWVICQ